MRQHRVYAHETLVASAKAAHLARRAPDYGVVIDGAVTVDMARVKARAQAVVTASGGGLEDWLGRMRGCTVLRGHAAFESPTHVRVGGNVLSAPRVFINVGGRAWAPNMPSMGEVPHLDNSSILALDRVAEHLVVVGGSYVGLEFAQVFRRFGAAVTIGRDAAALDRAGGRGRLDRHRGHPAGRGDRCANERQVRRLQAARARGGRHRRLHGGGARGGGFASVARRGAAPNTDDLGLERAGVATDARGFITVDETLATNVPGIWALGDCNGRGASTHTAYNDFEIVAANLLDGASRRLSERIPAYALYIDPPLGRVGVTEAKARASGRPLLVGSRPMTRVLRAIEKGEPRGS